MDVCPKEELHESNDTAATYEWLCVPPPHPARPTVMTYLCIGAFQKRLGGAAGESCKRAQAGCPAPKGPRTVPDKFLVIAPESGRRACLWSTLSDTASS